MSGPKVSLYRLEPYIRENILKQQRLKRRCISLHRQITDKLADIESLSERCSRFLENRISTGKDGEAVNACGEILETIRIRKKETAEKLRAAGKIERMPQKYRYSPETVEQDTEKVRQLEAALQACEAADEEVRQKTVAVLNAYEADYEQAAREAAKAVQKAGRFDFSEIAVKRIRNDWSRRDSAADELRQIAADPDLTDGLRERARKAVQTLLAAENEHTADNYIAITAGGIRKDAERERNRRAEEYREFSERIRDYHAICEELGTEPAEIPFTDNWREETGEVLHRLEITADAAGEKGYISDCLDTVMAEMGYRVIGYRKVRKKSGKSFRSSLYSYADGRAIHVTQSDDGQITMELGGLDHCDRLPESREAEALEQDMYSFCDSFAEIERRLQKKGVTMAGRISKPAPNQEYATIINLNDFILTGGQEAGTIETADSEQTTSAKEMHLE